MQPWQRTTRHCCCRCSVRRICHRTTIKLSHFKRVPSNLTRPGDNRPCTLLFLFPFPFWFTFALPRRIWTDCGKTDINNIILSDLHKYLKLLSLSACIKKLLLFSAFWYLKFFTVQLIYFGTTHYLSTTALKIRNHLKYWRLYKKDP